MPWCVCVWGRVKEEGREGGVLLPDGCYTKRELTERRSLRLSSQLQWAERLRIRKLLWLPEYVLRSTLCIAAQFTIQLRLNPGAGPMTTPGQLNKPGAQVTLRAQQSGLRKSA